MAISWIEGYPLFGLYQVTFPPNFDFSKDLTLRFYYQWPLYVSAPPPTGVPIRFSCKDYSGKPVPVTSPEVSLLLGQAADGSRTIGDAGAVSPTRTCLRFGATPPTPREPQAVSDRHSARAAERRAL
jgi:hypothetical protein